MNKKVKDILNKRHVCNVRLANLLRVIADTYPDLRFSQILSNFDFVKNSGTTGQLLDEFYTESEIVLERVEKQMKKVYEDINKK